MLKINYSLVVVTNSVVEDKVVHVKHIKDYDSQAEAYKVLKRFNDLFGKLMDDTNRQMAVLCEVKKVNVIHEG